MLTVLIIGYVWPEPQSSAAGLRDWNLIDTFQSVGWKVHFASHSKENAFSEKLKFAGIDVHPISPNDPEFDKLVEKLNPDFVIFDRFVIEEQFGWRVQEVCPHAIRILDTQDLHFLRRGREKWLRNWDTGSLKKDLQDQELDLDLEKLTLNTDLLFSEDSLREIASIYRCDTTLVLSSFELKLLVQNFKIPEELLHLSRFHYSNPPTGLSYQDRRDFIIIGNFRHPPNADGIRWFQKSIWPSIRKNLPTAQVHIYGAYPPKEFMSLTNPEQGFHVLGFAPNQFETLKKYRVNLAPLRYGAGIKGKITDGWWSGTPTVATLIGAEGMADEMPWGGEVAKNAKEFIEKAISLYSDSTCWETSQKNGYHLIRSLYSNEVNAKNLIEHCLMVKANIKQMRKDNFIGTMLTHHLLRSTKYFSKWIEEKAKKGTPCH